MQKRNELQEVKTVKSTRKYRSCVEYYKKHNYLDSYNIMLLTRMNYVHACVHACVHMHSYIPI